MARDAGRSSWCERREAIRARVQSDPPSHISAEEIEVHFSGMPPHYWECVTDEAVLWGLETIHGFLQLIAMPNVPPTVPFVNWRPAQEKTQTQIMLCTWDRHGLLAKAAAAFSAVRLNIVQAEVFTRADNIVLDVFTVADSSGHGPASSTRLKEMSFLLEGALGEPPRFASVWACSRHKFLAPPAQHPPRISFDNESSPVATIVRIESPDRLGLLYDILQALADGGLGITQASIKTDEGLAHDLIHVTHSDGQKVVQEEELGKLRRSLEAAIEIAPA